MSEVGLAIKGEALQQLSKETINQKVLDSADKHFQDKDDHLFIWNHIGWDDYEVNSLIDDLFNIGCNNYYLLDLRKVDDDYNDDLEFDGEWYDEPFDLRITKHVRFDSRNCIDKVSTNQVQKDKCDCGGTGVRDFGLYTRVCECKLGK